MEQLFVNKPTGKQPNFNGPFHLVALVTMPVVAHMLSNPWWIMNGKLPIQWTLEKEKKMMDEYCAKDDDERDTAITQL